MLTVRIQEKNYSESIMVLKLKDGCACRIRTGYLNRSSSRTAFREEILSGSVPGSSGML